MIAPLLMCLTTACAFENVRVEVGDGTVLERATVVVQHGRILSVGQPAPAGAQRIDGAGKVLTPGLIEARSSLGVVEVELEDATTDESLHGEALTPGFRVADGFDPSSVWIPVTRQEGITSAITRPQGGILYGTGAWFELTGRLSSRPDPAKPTAMFGGVGTGAAMSAGSARGGAWLKLRQAFDDARLFAANPQAFQQNRTRTLSLSPLHLAALQPVLRGELPLVLDASRASDILSAISFAKEQRIRIVINGGAEAWRVARQLAAEKIPVILTPSIQDPATFETLRARDDAPAILDRAGVPLIISTESGVSPRRARQEAGLAVAYGLPRERALRAITLTPAEVFGKAGELGSITTGKRANLVLWSGDPLETSTLAERVFIDGEEQSAETRHTRLRDRYLEVVPAAKR